jgi:hypothetical protein
MRNGTSQSLSRPRRVTLSYSDSIDLVNHQIEWSPKGVSLITKWPFAEGREIEFSFVHQGRRHRCIGTVVACHALREPRGFYSTLLYFVDEPCRQACAAACDCHLADEVHRPAHGRRRY